MRYLLLIGVLVAAPAAWAADMTGDGDSLEQPTNATSGASRLGGTEITSTPHMQQGLGQSPSPVTNGDIEQAQAQRVERQEKRQAERDAKAMERDTKAAGEAAAQAAAQVR